MAARGSRQTVALVTVRVFEGPPSRAVETCDGAPPPLPMEPTTSSPALSIAIAVLAVLLALTGFGVYTAFGPPSKELTDPFDDHED